MSLLGRCVWVWANSAAFNKSMGDMMGACLWQGQGMQNPLQNNEWQGAVADLVAEGAAPLRNGNPITDSNSQVRVHLLRASQSRLIYL